MDRPYRFYTSEARNIALTGHISDYLWEPLMESLVLAYIERLQALGR
jgi:hypothetical protein